MPFQITIDRDADIDALKPSDVRTAIDERSLLLHNIFEEAGPELDASKVKVVDVKDGHDLAAQIEQRNNELTKLGVRQSEIDKLEAFRAENERRRNAPGGPSPDLWAPRQPDNRQPPAPQSWGAMFVASDLYKAARNRQRANAAIELPIDPQNFLRGPQNTEFTTSAGWAPESLRTGRVVLDAQREIEVSAAFPVFPTTQAAVVYMEETTFTNNAAERAESGAYAESALALTERSQTVRSIGTSLPVTDEQLADEASVGPYLDQRLGFMVRQRLDGQLITGNGIAPNLLGTLNVGSINSQAKGADNTPDAIYKGADLVRVTGRANPSVVISHPTDWQAVRLLKTADGIYIWGSPMDAGPARIWGLPVILTTAITQGIALVGDYARFAALYMRQGLEVMTGYVNDDFTDGRVTIRAGLRCAVVHFRPEAFTQVTGL